MQRVRGACLSDIWGRLSEHEQTGYLMQLAEMVQELRAIPREPSFGDRICSTVGGSFVDFRIGGGSPCGPFENEAIFNQALCLGSDTPPTVKVAHSIVHDLVFTHGDLAFRNVIVDNGRIAAIVDWEGAGWFPAHWEYVKAFYAVAVRSSEWATIVPRFVPEYRTEYLADLQLWPRAQEVL